MRARSFTSGGRFVTPSMRNTHFPPFSTMLNAKSAFHFASGASWTLPASWGALASSSETKAAMEVMSVIRRKSGQVLPNDQRVDVVRPFIGIDGLQVASVPHCGILVQDAVSPQDVPGDPRDVQRLVHVVPLGDRDLDERR